MHTVGVDVDVSLGQGQPPRLSGWREDEEKEEQKGEAWSIVPTLPSSNPLRTPPRTPDAS